ncbi:glycoside hydrolase family 76 protein [Mucilaginibacter lappiensis]|uniref:Alpha-1,6-mannanase (GH76 family) n=1 Tax=Mucilaginibacter lappiensis TaxID=354630 RepID=A0A1N6PK15_9SPHI|nr:glycoside hydrolase family 76 protein [Mucilaginibacter lappiensis]MBB6107552.1 putative alpha-1,6-mannanase (GH76 family) [Mucilaginibacter lappiensis]MBB6126127.1 putative alpha-1,6-mannanase (GH76 family) [Mucilaginibacter lappiensis]SIQ04637.1 Predicted alpha-1,6-mannanase, GH76 family [Mucilaginibacter lappiensis]
MKKKLILHITAISMIWIALAVCSCSKKNDPITPPKTVDTTVKGVTYNYSSLADSLQNTTYSAFISANGNYYIQNNAGNTNFNYWPNAHMLDVLTDAYLRTQSVVYSQRMKTLLNGIKITNGGGYPNEFYDDMGWLANASLRDYTITHDADYLNVAQQLYTEIKGGSNTIAGGGIAWQRSQLYYKNIPSTGNATILAARFYELQNKPEDLALAKSLYNWMKNNLVNPTSGVVLDGINRNQDGQVDNWIFTYNQGLFIGSAVELYNITKDPMYLQDAIRTANNEIADPNLTVNGILKNEGQGDGGLFKGVVVRYLTLLVELSDLDATNKAKYANFLQMNAESLSAKGISRPSMMISPDWTKLPSGSTDLTTQLSGVMMIEAAAKLKTEGKIQ